MDRSQVLADIAAVAQEVLGADPTRVSESSRFKDDLDADSLDLVEFVMGLEERFDITVPEDQLEGITTVGAAVDLVLRAKSESLDA
ncbi:MAG: acyl carrier protein [Acidimicrobiales bacterium]